MSACQCVTAYQVKMPAAVETHTAYEFHFRQLMPNQRLMPMNAGVVRMTFSASITSVNVLCRTSANSTITSPAIRPTHR